MSSATARAYLAWNELVRAQDPARSEEIVIDNLSGLRFDGAALSAEEIFRALTPGAGDEATRLKLEQSASFRTFRNVKPTIENLRATGTVFVDVTADDLAELRARATPPKLELPSEDVRAFVRRVGDQGLRALESLYGQGAPLDWRVELADLGHDFNAKVITDAAGGLVCVLPPDAVPGGRLGATVFHEVAGHVYHFSHLRRNEELRARSPHLLCVCLHTHEGCYVEGIAQLLVLLALERGSGIDHVAEYRALNDGWTLTMALAHANLGALLRGERDLAQAVEFHLAHDVSTRWTRERLEGLYASSLGDYFACKTTLSYFASYRIVRPLLRKTDAELRGILPELLSSYFTPTELRAFVGRHA